MVWFVLLGCSVLLNVALYVALRMQYTSRKDERLHVALVRKRKRIEQIRNALRAMQNWVNNSNICSPAEQEDIDKASACLIRELDCLELEVVEDRERLRQMGEVEAGSEE